MEQTTPESDQKALPEILGMSSADMRSALMGIIGEAHHAETLLRKNLPGFLAALKEAKIDFVMYDYDGGGDSGCVQAPKYYRYGQPGEDRADYLTDVLEALVGRVFNDGLAEATPPTQALSWLRSERIYNQESKQFEQNNQISDLSFELAAENLGDLATDHLLGYMWFDGDLSSDGMIGLNVKTGKMVLRGRESAYTYRDEEFSLDDELDSEVAP